MKKSKRSPRKFAYDVLVIGAGSAGLSAAFAARQAGATVAMIAADKMGGECPNYACVPTKAMLVAALRYDDFKRNASKFGINARSVTLNVEAMMARKDAVVSAMTGRHRLEKILEKAGVTLFRGIASFVDDESVKVGTHLISAKSFVIATGSIPKIPPIAGIESITYWTPREAVEITELPASIAIIGGGPIGCEFATFFSLCDVPVVMFDVAPRLLPREDAENATFAERELKHRGVAFHGNTKVLSVIKDRNHLRITFQTGDAPRQTLRVEKLLVASGRTP
ncbi:MAG: FAD-dependent oxidoreductase, partial [Methylococcaceae bacterium]